MIRGSATLLACLACTPFTPLGAQDPIEIVEPSGSPPAAQPWVVYDGTPEQGATDQGAPEQRAERPGAGRHVVFVTGDEEYRSEESMPQLARLLAFRLGFTCTVLFAIDRDHGRIDPGVRDHIPGLDALDDADLMVIFTRFRDLPDAQMQHVVRYVESGKPIVGLRTATHAFDLGAGSSFRRYGWRAKEWDGGFGRQVLGETWIAHHGDHGTQSTRGVAAPGRAGHPILRGLDPSDVWDPADVYAVRLPLPAGCTPILLGQVLDGMTPDADPAAPRTRPDGSTDDRNDPMMPIAWTRSLARPDGPDARVFTTTLGAAEAFAHAGTRRLVVHGALWALGLEDAITPDLDVGLVGPYQPSPFGFGKHRAGVRPADLAWPPR